MEPRHLKMLRRAAEAAADEAHRVEGLLSHYDHPTIAAAIKSALAPTRKHSMPKSPLTKRPRCINSGVPKRKRTNENALRTRPKQRNRCKLSNANLGRGSPINVRLGHGFQFRGSCPDPKNHDTEDAWRKSPEARHLCLR
jgi:hypothetical protein